MILYAIKDSRDGYFYSRHRYFRYFSDRIKIQSLYINKIKAEATMVSVAIRNPDRRKYLSVVSLILSEDNLR